MKEQFDSSYSEEIEIQPNTFIQNMGYFVSDTCKDPFPEQRHSVNLLAEFLTMKSISE